MQVRAAKDTSVKGKSIRARANGPALDRVAVQINRPACPRMRNRTEVICTNSKIGRADKDHTPVKISQSRLLKLGLRFMRAAAHNPALKITNEIPMGYCQKRKSAKVIKNKIARSANGAESDCILEADAVSFCRAASWVSHLASLASDDGSPRIIRSGILYSPVCASGIFRGLAVQTVGRLCADSLQNRRVQQTDSTDQCNNGWAYLRRALSELFKLRRHFSICAMYCSHQFSDVAFLLQHPAV
jgi:hypothetical protein